jgi:hypothetical protein
MEQEQSIDPLHLNLYRLAIIFSITGNKKCPIHIHLNGKLEVELEEMI